MNGKERYHFVDALRGLSVLLMILHHFAFDLLDIGLFPESLLFHPVIGVLHVLFASVFVAISGASSTFSRGNLKRGIIILAGALAVSAATYLYDAESFIRFGILHLLGVAAILYDLLARTAFLQKVPGPVWLALFCVAYPLQQREASEPGLLYFLGIGGNKVATLDYFPLIPWILMYFFGVWLGRVIREHRLPEPLYRWRNPFLEKCGRHTLWIYLLHQPLLLLLTQGIVLLMK